jgi:hypothetical protein
MGRYGPRPGGRYRATAAVWKEIVVQVRRRAEERCEACRGTAGPFEFHHVVKRSQGGPDLAWNLAYLCRNCHAATDASYAHGRLVTEIFCASTPERYLAIAGMAALDGATRDQGERDGMTGIRISMQYGPGKRTVTRQELVRMIRISG